jgi:hypothetical protein
MSNNSNKKRPALIISVDGKEREVTFEELTLSNNLTLEVLMRLLIDKNLIDPDEFMTKLQELKNERFKTE